MRIHEIVNLFELGLIIPGINTTNDVSPDSTKKQAAKFGNDVTTMGIPPIIQSNGKFKPPI